MVPLLISLAVFVGVAALIGGLSLVLRGDSNNKLEDRLDILAGNKSASVSRDPTKESLLAHLNAPGFFELLLERFGGFSRLFEQADTSLTAARFVAISGVLAVCGVGLGLVTGAGPIVAPLFAITFAVMPLMWLIMRRRKRLKKFAAQLPDALELIARALRAGHSLGSGMNLVGEEMPAPIGFEFQRVFEEQNLGIPLDDALRELTQRVPNLDLKFFVTAVVLQKQTGGDLAEILDKIGYLIRERFKIWGQVQALTGEGRLSGIVLLALPPLLFLAVYYLNPDYVMVLFEDPMGQSMLMWAVILQLLGAVVIKKIVNIKV